MPLKKWEVKYNTENQVICFAYGYAIKKNCVKLLSGGSLFKK